VVGPFSLADDFPGTGYSIDGEAARRLPLCESSHPRAGPAAIAAGPPSFIVRGFPMSTWFRSSRGGRRVRPRHSISPALEGLDPRRLLDGGVGSAGPAIVSRLEDLADHGRDEGPTGVVVKAPHFYENYVGPKLPQLNAVAAAGELLPDGSFLFAGVNQGKIDPTVPQTYVWGVDRNGKLPTGPFPGRPDIRFDAVVVLTLKPGQPTTASVVDLTTFKTTVLPAGTFLAEGRLVAVAVPAAALPTTGLAPALYKFNYWPEDGGQGATHIASFAPEFNDAQVGVLDDHDDGRDDGHGDRFDVNEVVAVLTGDQDGKDDGDGHGDKKHGRG
jgi:hypothetical protein